MKRSLAFNKGLAPQVIAIEHQQIEGAGEGEVIEAATVQAIKVRHAVLSSAHDLSVDDCGVFDPGGIFKNERVTFRPICRIHRIEPHPPIADVDLQPVAVVLQFMHPTGTARRVLSHVGRQGWMKAAGAFLGLPRELRTRHNIATVYCENRNGATDKARLASEVELQCFNICVASQSLQRRL